MNNREIDALVAEKVMGFVPDAYMASYGLLIPHFSTIIESAFMVVDKLGEGGLPFSLCSEYHDNEKPYWHWVATFESPPTPIKNYKYYECVDKSAPMAICLAALKSVGVELPKSVE